MSKNPNTKKLVHRNRVMRLQVTLDAILEMAKQHEPNLPQDSQPLGAYYDYTTESFWVVVSSSEFDEVEEGDIIPTL